jgi:hypothetical protein
MKMNNKIIEAGQRVISKCDVDRYPHFVIPEGSKGTVTSREDHLILVKMDDPIEGMEDWNNELQITDDNFVYSGSKTIDEELRTEFDLIVEIRGESFKYTDHQQANDRAFNRKGV